jgi:hypothetical protein
VASSEVRFTLRSRVRSDECQVLSSDVLKQHQVRATLAEGGRSSIPGIARHNRWRELASSVSDYVILKKYSVFNLIRSD